MIEDVIDFSAWVAPKTKDLLGNFLDKKNKPEPKVKSIQWQRFKNELSPLDTYKYLKARFGLPNGVTMIAKSQSLDNLIHWHYTIECKGNILQIFGHSRGLEIIIQPLTQEISESDREIFVKALKKDFSKYAKLMKDVQGQFEHWLLFINPYVRLYKTIHKLIIELEGLDVEEGKDISSESSSDDRSIHKTSIQFWIGNVNRAAAIGTTLRMLFPILLESFVNLLIYTFRKQEFKDDVRLYDNLFRQQIDIRVKSLHLNCDGFRGPVDGKDQRFKDFHTLMNRRNDFLHGNVDPIKLQVEDIYIDEKYTPLYSEDEGIIKKILKKANIGVSLPEVLEDERVVNEFIGLVLDNLDTPSFETFTNLMAEQFPGINKSTNKLGIVLPEMYVEGMVFEEKKIEEDSDYHHFVDDNGEFEMYLPVNWKHWIVKDRHYFKPYELHKSEHLIFSMVALDVEEIKLRMHNLEQFEKLNLGGVEYYTMPTQRLSITYNNSYFSFLNNNMVHFTFTFPIEMNDNPDNRTNEQLVKEAEKVIGSFKIINEVEKERILKSYRFESFIKGIATTQLLLSNAFEHKAYFEVITILFNEVDAMLRISIILKLQIQNGNSEIDDKWIFQKEGSEKTTTDDVLSEVLNLGIVELSLADNLRQLNERRMFLLGNFIISPIPVPEFEEFAFTLYKAKETVTLIVEALENEQAERGVGMVKDGSAPGSRFYAEFVKGRVARQPYFQEKLLNIMSTM